MKDRKHKIIFVEYKKELEEIDEKIAPLIFEIWKAGLKTCNSCQSNPKDYIWIEFCNIKNASKFLEIVIKYDKVYGSMYWRALNNYGSKNWLIDTSLFDCYLIDEIRNEEVVHIHKNKNNEIKVDFRVSIRFPKKDYSIILKRMKNYNK